MSTPAANVNAAVNGPAGTNPAAQPTAVTPPGATPANEPFWNTWAAPEQKDVKEWVANKAYADPFVLAKSFKEAEGSMATLRAQASIKGYPVDKVNADGSVTKADQNAKQAWNALAGVPENPQGYDLSSMPEAKAYPEYMTAIQTAAYENGLPPQALMAIAGAHEKAMQGIIAKAEADAKVQSEQQLLELKRSWGPQFDERAALANRGKTWMMKETGMNEAQINQIERLSGTDKFLSMMWKFGAGNREPGFAGGDGGAGFGNNKAQAQTALDQLTADRTAGKINQYEFAAKSKALMDIIVA